MDVCLRNAALFIKIKNCSYVFIDLTSLSVLFGNLTESNGRQNKCADAKILILIMYSCSEV